MIRSGGAQAPPALTEQAQRRIAEYERFRNDAHREQLDARDANIRLDERERALVDRERALSEQLAAIGGQQEQLAADRGQFEADKQEFAAHMQRAHNRLVQVRADFVTANLIPETDTVPEIPGALLLRSLVGNELVGVGTIGIESALTTTGAIAALAAQAGGETYVKLGSANSFALGNGSVDGQRVGIKDNLGRASPSNPITITGNIDGGTQIVMVQARQTLEFVWDAADNFWMVF